MGCLEICVGVLYTKMATISVLTSGTVGLITTSAVFLVPALQAHHMCANIFVPPELIIRL